MIESFIGSPRTVRTDLEARSANGPVRLAARLRSEVGVVFCTALLVFGEVRVDIKHNDCSQCTRMPLASALDEDQFGPLCEIFGTHRHPHEGYDENPLCSPRISLLC